MFFKKCKHDWQVQADRMVPSIVERLSDKGMTNFTITSCDLESTHIVIMSCSKCGKVNKTITKV